MKDESGALPPSSFHLHPLAMHVRPYIPADLLHLKRLTTEGFVGVSVDHGIEQAFGPINGHDWQWRKARHIDDDAAANARTSHRRRSASALYVATTGRNRSALRESSAVSGISETDTPSSAVDALAVDLGQEVVQPVETALLRPPVEAVAPVGHQLAEVGEIRSLLPAGLRRRGGPSRPGEPMAQVIEVVVRDFNAERLDVRRFRHHAPEAPGSPTSVA